MAIARYYEPTPEPVKYKRFPVVKRHLRKVYADPFFPKQGMALIVRDGRIVGVHSQSLQAPIRSEGYQEFQSSFKSAKHYRERQFIYEPNTLADLE